MNTFREINIDTTGELADALRAFPGATRLRLFMGDDKDAMGAWGGIAEDGSFELHIDDEHNPSRAARLDRERQAVRDAVGDERDVEAELTPAARKARDRNREVRERAAMQTEPRDKFAELGVKEAPAGQPTGAEDQNVREGAFDRNKTGLDPAAVVEHRRAVERAAAEPRSPGGDQGKQVPVQKAEAVARNPASLATRGNPLAPLPDNPALPADKLAAAKADLREQDAEARSEQDAKARDEAAKTGQPPLPETPAERTAREAQARGDAERNRR